MQRKLLFRLLIALTAVATGSLVAPALSTTPYAPEAVSFGERLPAAERIPERARAAIARAGDHAGHEHGELRFQTPEIEAPKRFDLVGLGGETRPYEVRTRSGGGWSEWVEVSDAGPVVAVGSDAVQIRAAFEPRGEIDFINVTGTASLADRLVNELRGSVNSALISSASLLGADAEAATRRPRIINRRRWDPRGQCRPRRAPEYGRVRGAAIHHTVSTNGYSEQQAAGIVLGICLHHRNSNRWNDIGYNFLADSYGNLYTGRAGGRRRAVIGAHAIGFNSDTTGVAAIGNHSQVQITRRTHRSLKQLLSWKLSHHGIKRPRSRFRYKSTGGSGNRFERGTTVRVRRIFSHGDVNYTECAGTHLNQRVPRLRRAVHRKVRRYFERVEGGGTSGGAARR